MLSELTRQTTIWKKLLDKADAEIKKATYTDIQLSKMTSQLEKTSLDRLNSLLPRMSRSRKMPKSCWTSWASHQKWGSPAEAPEVVKQRKEILKRFTQTDGATRSANSLLETIRANQENCSRSAAQPVQQSTSRKRPFSLHLVPLERRGACTIQDQQPDQQDSPWLVAPAFGQLSHTSYSRGPDNLAHTICPDASGYRVLPRLP